MSKPQSDRKPFRRTSKRPAGDASAVDDIIYGLHACEAALANPHRSIRRAFATENAARKLATAFAERGLVPEPASPRQLDARRGPDTVHQGILLEVEPLETTELITIIENAAETGAPILVLDQVTDPHNVGAVLRSAAVFGAAGLVMTRRHSPPLGATVAKAASGACTGMA